MGVCLARSVRPGGHAALGKHTGEATIEGHYTGHFKAVITKPQSAPPPIRTFSMLAHEHPLAMADVLVMRDVRAAAMSRAATRRGSRRPRPASSLDAAATNIMKRLSFADDAGARYGSMLAYPAFDEQFRSGHLDTDAQRRLSALFVARHARLAGSGITTRSCLGRSPGHRRRPQLLPRRREAVCHLLADAQPAPSALWRGHEGAFATASRPAGAVCSPRASLWQAAENQDFISQGTALHYNTHTHSGCASRVLTHESLFRRLDQQRDLLPRPAPHLRPVHQVLHEPDSGQAVRRSRRSRTSAIAPTCRSPLLRRLQSVRCDPGGEPATRSPLARFGARLTQCPLLFGRCAAAAKVFR